MDHRVSKDMISSGMIPAGEKKKEDLGRTQYGSAPSPSSLADAYKSMYDKKEETLNEHHKKDADGNTIPHEGDEINEALPLIPAIGAALKPIMGIVAKKGLGAAVKTVASKAGSKIGGSMGRKLAYKAADTVVKNPINTVVGAQMVGNMIPKPSMPAVTKKQNQGGMVSADTDLFDIIKGQLLDEGLSEEEIKDIMLTLTPDEIMSEMAVNPNIAAMDAKNKADMIARAQANKVPDKVKEASKRQMKAGTPREDKNNPYTTQDKKTIIDYNKNK